MKFWVETWYDGTVGNRMLLLLNWKQVLTINARWKWRKKLENYGSFIIRRSYWKDISIPRRFDNYNNFLMILMIMCWCVIRFAEFPRKYFKLKGSLCQEKLSLILYLDSIDKWISTHYGCDIKATRCWSYSIW